MELAVLLVQAFAEGFYSLFGGIYPQKDNHRQDGQFYAGEGMVCSDGDTNGGQYPDAGSGGDAYYDAIAGENHTGTEKANARYNLTDDPQVQGRFVIYAGERRECVRANAYKDAGPDADRLA